MDEALLHDEVDRLYAVPREAFVDQRDRRVKALRAEGLREEAAALERRRKPTVPAWAVNQLPRRHPEQVDALIGAATDLRTAERGAGGDGGARLRDAADDLRERLATLRQRAEAVIAEAGSTPLSHIDDVERTLRAAAAAPCHHDTLRRGVFERPLKASGFTAGGGLAAGDSGASEPGSDAATAEREERRRRRERRQRLERDRRNLESSRERQRRSAERAQDEADRLRLRADRATRAAQDETAELARLEQELADVTDELDRPSPAGE